LILLVFRPLKNGPECGYVGPVNFPCGIDQTGSSQDDKRGWGDISVIVCTFSFPASVRACRFFVVGSRILRMVLFLIFLIFFPILYPNIFRGFAWPRPCPFRTFPCPSRSPPFGLIEGLSSPKVKQTHVAFGPIQCQGFCPSLVLLDRSTTLRFSLPQSTPTQKLFPSRPPPPHPTGPPPSKPRHPAFIFRSDMFFHRLGPPQVAKTGPNIAIRARYATDPGGIQQRTPSGSQIHPPREFFLTARKIPPPPPFNPRESAPIFRKIAPTPNSPRVPPPLVSGPRPPMRRFSQSPLPCRPRPASPLLEMSGRPRGGRPQTVVRRLAPRGNLKNTLSAA